MLAAMIRSEFARAVFSAVVMTATDPANPHGAILKWPDTFATATRSAGARVVLVDGSAAVEISADGGAVRIAPRLDHQFASGSDHPSVELRALLRRIGPALD